jgi:hypothetical protein
MYYPSVFHEEVRKITKNLEKDRRCPGRHSNRVLPEYDYTLLGLRQPARHYRELLSPENRTLFVDPPFLSQLGNGRAESNKTEETRKSKIKVQ